MTLTCALVIPCRNEAPALRDLLPRVPDRMTPVVVDNGSTDGTAAVAGDLGVRVVHEPQAGYGAALHAGIAATTADIVAVIDGDGTFDPVDLLPLLDAVESGRCDLAMGVRTGDGRGLVPWQARAGNALICWWLRRHGLVVHDIGPVRVCKRDALLDLDVRDRRYGYPFELLRKAAAAGWRVEELPVAYGRRAAGTRSKVSGSLRGTVRAAVDAVRVLS